MFEEDFEKLTRGEQAQFRKVVSDLLYRCYIVRRMYDRATKMNKISADYLFIEKHFDLLCDYLSFAGMEVSKDDDNGVVFLTSEDETNRIRIDGVTTLILYALRSFYEEKLKDNPSVNEIYCDSTSLKVLLKDLGLTTVTRRISALSLASSLRTLAMYQIVVPAKGSFGENAYAFFILPSIRYVISNAKLNALYSAIKEINEGEEDEEGLFNADTEKDDDEKENSDSPKEGEGAEENVPEEGGEINASEENVSEGEEK